MVLDFSTTMEKYVGFHPTFSRHGRVGVSSTLLIWLNENVHIIATSYHLGASITFNSSKRWYVSVNDVRFVMISVLFPSTASRKDRISSK